MLSYLKKIKLDELKDINELIIRTHLIIDTCEQGNYSLSHELSSNREMLKKTNKLLHYSQYKRYKDRIRELEEKFAKLNKEKEQLIEQINALVKQLFPSLLADGYEQTFSNIIEYSTQIKDAITIKDLNMTLDDAIKLLEAHDFPIVLCEEDKTIIENEERYDGLHNFILVHKTNFIPEGCRIRSAKESNIQRNYHFALQKIGIVNYKEHRNTVHFAVNGEVGSHAYGNWDQCQYAILIPFNEVPVSKLKSGNPVDTYIEGGLDLPSDAIILCNENELEKVKKEFPKLRVIGYKGSNVSGYANALVSMLGYRYEKIGTWDWMDSKDSKQYHQMFDSKYGLPSDIVHQYSEEFINESVSNDLDKFKNTIDKILNEEIPVTSDDIRNMLREFKLFNPNKNEQMVVLEEIKEHFKKNGMNIEKEINRIEEFVLQNFKYNDEEEKKFSSNDFIAAPDKFMCLLGDAVTITLFYQLKLRSTNKILDALKRNIESNPLFDIELFLKANPIFTNDNDLNISLSFAIERKLQELNINISLFLLRNYFGKDYLLFRQSLDDLSDLFDKSGLLDANGRMNANDSSQIWNNIMLCLIKNEFGKERDVVLH